MDIIKFPDKDALEKAINEPVYDDPLESAKKKFTSTGRDCYDKLSAVFVIIGILCIIGGSFISDTENKIFAIIFGVIVTGFSGGYLYYKWKSCRVKSVAKSLSKITPWSVSDLSKKVGI